MSSNRSRRLRRGAAEALLDGAPATEATRPLAALLHAAAASAHPEELAGQRAAVAAFEEAAHLDPVPDPRRPNVLKSTLASLLSVKAAIALAAAVGTTGVVLASATGVLSPSHGPSEHQPADHPPAVHSTHTPAGTPRNDGDESGRSGEAPSPSMAGLCNAYEAHKGDNPGKALDSPAFTALITAAGGKDNVDGYCDAITAGTDHGQSGDTHGKPADPGDAGNGNANDGNDNGNGHNGDGAPAATHPASPPSHDRAPDNPHPAQPE